MNLNNMIKKVKNHPDFGRVGMVLSHNGVVRETSRDGRQVTGLQISVDLEKLETIIIEQKSRPGIVEILVDVVDDGKRLQVGDDVMYIVVAGDVRERVIETLTDTLNAIKKTVTQKKEFFSQVG